MRALFARVNICCGAVIVLAGMAVGPARSATYTVTNANDSGTGSLRQAILDANANSGADVITFSIGSGSASIAPISALPEIADDVTIDGSTQPGFAGTPLVELNGGSAGDANGLLISAGKATIKGLVINRFARNGIFLSGAGGSSIKGCYLGTNASGTAATGVQGGGIEIHSPNNVVGGVTAVDRNVISGNSAMGVQIADGNAIGNTVKGNFIGTDVAGTHKIPNGQWGVRICCGSSSSIVGGTAAGAGNLISGNQSGIDVADYGTNANVIQGNLIGTDVSGIAALGNQGSGVYVCCSATNTLIGGTSAAARNVICANGVDGGDAVRIEYAGTTGTLVQGNYIGVDATGKTALGNTWNNVGLGYGTTNNTIGGTVPGAGNVISGSKNSNGVQICDEGTTGNLVAGNYIGTDSAGTTKISNAGSGVYFCGGAKGNTVGGTAVGARNLLSGNSGNGVSCEGIGTQQNAVLGNFIGTDVTGLLALQNGNNGVAIWASASGNIIGGYVPAARNIISGNAGRGVEISDIATRGNIVAGNYIGPDSTGLAALANLAPGVAIDRGATQNTIGGAVTGAGNVISGSAPNQPGVFITDPGTNENIVAGNLVGTDATGMAALPNAVQGVFISNGPSNNIIGGIVPAARNVVSGNTDNGIRVAGVGSNGNIIRGNYVGLDITGLHALPNAYRGINVSDGPLNTVIGGSVPGSRNVVSGNQDSGIVVEGAHSSGTTVQGNFVGTDFTGRTAVPNVNEGVGIWGGATNTLVGGTTAGARNVISGNGDHGVYVVDPTTHDTTIQGNYVGTDPTGTLRVGNVNNGVNIGGGSHNNIVGGTATGAGNLLSANTRGIAIVNEGTNNNVVQGNLIGTDATGSVRLGNGFAGVEICCGAYANTVGGTTAAARNVIADSAYGVRLAELGATGNTVQGNYIGTDITGQVGLGCGTDAVNVSNGANSSIIGGTAPGAANTIAWSSRNGVGIEGAPSPTGITVSRNRIFSNSALGIDLGADGVTRNHAGGAISGPNLRQNTPIITSAVYSSGSATIAGKLNAGANATYTVELFNSPAAHASGYGEGKTFITSASVTTDAAGNATFNASGTVTAPVGLSVSATATDSAGNTSEFSPAFPLAGVPANPALVVTNTNDSGTGSLRQAILDANARAGADTITFNIDPGGIVNIYPNSPLPEITDDVTIDGTTQPGYLGRPLITLTGWSAGDTNGLAVTGGKADIKALCINYWNRYGIDLGTAGNTVEGCWIGIDNAGVNPWGNGRGAVRIASANNTIGGAAAGAGNVLSGNDTGIDLVTTAATGNTVLGNIIGGDPTGTFRIGNNRGIRVTGGASNNLIGGVTPAARNIISGNYGNGVEMSDAGTSGNIVRGNFIGTDISGANALSNWDHGVFLRFFVTSTVIGGSAPGAGNVISGNETNGVTMTDSGTTGNSVLGNFIGTDAAGVQTMPNLNAGVTIESESGGNTIGGTTAGARNLISGNRDRGIIIVNSASNTLQGNFVGTDVSGTKAIPNGSLGINVVGGSSSNTIGGSAAGAGNLVSGNNQSGIGVWDANSKDNVIQGNLVGTDLTGTLKVPNGNDGIDVGDGAANTIVGGTAPGAGNLASGNNASGIVISGGAETGALVQGNFCGADITGTKPVGNGQNGILLCCDAHDNTIGGTTVAARNLLSGNSTGLNLATGRNNTVQGNYFGVDITGTGKLGNIFDGISVCCSSSNNAIGGTVAGAANVIAANGQDGIEINDTGTTLNTILGNIIGTDAAIALDLGNGRNGVSFANGSTGNTVGGVAAGAGNVIAHSRDRGVALWNPENVHDAIRGNRIFGSATLGIDLANDGVTPNHTGGGAAGANDLLNYPVLSTARSSAVDTVITGSYPGAASSSYSVDFYASPAAHSTGFGEGQTYLGSATVATDAAGAGNINQTFPVAVTPGWVVSATATNGVNDTSEFSKSIVVAAYQPVLSISTSAVNDASGNNNGVIDYNECVSLNLTVANTGNRPATGVTATLSTTTSSVAVTTAVSAYGDIAAGGSQTNSTAFKVSTSPLFVCGTPIVFNLKVVGAEGTFNLPLTVQTGVPGAPATFRATGPVAIPDGSFDGVDVPITVSGVTGPLASLTAGFFISHQYVSDLAVSLIGPDGTTIYLTVGNGGNGQNYGTSCPADTGGVLFDDAATRDISSGVAPFTGSYRPQQPLSLFTGKSGAAVNGVWKLHVEDVIAPDAGSVMCWALNIKARSCTDGGGQCAGSTLFGDANADGQVTNADVIAILRAAGGLLTVPNGGLATGDVAPKPSAAAAGFGDGKWTLLDAARLLRHLKGLDTVWP